MAKQDAQNSQMGAPVHRSLRKSRSTSAQHPFGQRFRLHSRWNSCPQLVEFSALLWQGCLDASVSEVRSLCVLYISAGEERQSDLRHFLEALQRDLQVLTGASTWALFKCRRLALFSKPTRWRSDLEAAKLDPFQGWPFFVKSDRSLGPPPHAGPHNGHSRKLLGRRKGGGFRTSAACPPACCKWLALLIDSLIL